MAPTPKRQIFTVTELSLNGETKGRSVVVEAHGPMQAALTGAALWDVLGEPYAIDVERQARGSITLSIRWESESADLRKRFTVTSL